MKEKEKSKTLDSMCAMTEKQRLFETNRDEVIIQAFEVSIFCFVRLRLKTPLSFVLSANKGPQVRMYHIPWLAINTQDLPRDLCDARRLGPWRVVGERGMVEQLNRSVGVSRCPLEDGSLCPP